MNNGELLIDSKTFHRIIEKLEIELEEYEEAEDYNKVIIESYQLNKKGWK